LKQGFCLGPVVLVVQEAGPLRLRRLGGLRRVPRHELHLFLRTQPLRALELFEHALQVADETGVDGLDGRYGRNGIHLAAEGFQLCIRVPRLSAYILTLLRDLCPQLFRVLCRA